MTIEQKLLQRMSEQCGRKITEINLISFLIAEFEAGITVEIADNEPYTLIDILKNLCNATDILLHKKDYDGSDYEIMENCLSRARKIIAKISNLSA